MIQGYQPHLFYPLSNVEGSNVIYLIENECVRITKHKQKEKGMLTIINLFLAFVGVSLASLIYTGVFIYSCNYILILVQVKTKIAVT